MCTVEGCNTKFLTPPDLDGHLKTCHLNKKCTVEGCTKGPFSKLYDYNRHMEDRHSGKTKGDITCSKCKKPFLNRKGRNLHQDVCMGKKKRQCPTCKVMLANSVEVANHRRMHAKKGD